VTETDSEDRVLGGGDGLLDVGDGGRDERGVTGTVGEEETIERLGLLRVPVVILGVGRNEGRKFSLTARACV
jgi:hypothetical protein